MYSRPLAGGAILLAALFLAPLAMAQEMTNVAGKIQSAGSNVVVIKDGVGAQRTFEVDRAASISQNGYPVPLEGLKVGATATLTLVRVGEREVAMSIVATSLFP